MKLSTLQECFEQAGKKFPFRLYWHIKNERKILVEFTGFRYDENSLSSHYTNKEMSDGWHDLKFKEKQYDYKTKEYDRNFEALIEK